MQVEYSFIIPTNLEKVAAALCSQAFNLEENNSRDEVISATYTLLERDENHCVFRIDCQEYGRGVSGGLDRRKRATSSATSRWDRTTRTLRWDWQSSETDRIRVQGTYYLNQLPAGTEVRLVHSFQVRIPVIGSSIARLIARDSRKAFPQIQAILNRHSLADPPAPQASG